MGQAVVDVVVDQDALGRRHRAFHRRELAGDVEAGFSPFDHPDDVSQMTLGALEPGETMAFFNDHDPIPLLRQIEQHFGNRVRVEYVSRAPEGVHINFHVQTAG